ncbi:KRTAP13L6 [Ovibos moschatus]
MLNVVKHLHKIIPKLSTLSSIKVTMLVKFQESVKPEKNTKDIRASFHGNSAELTSLVKLSYNCCSGNFSSCSLGDHLYYQAPPVTPPSLATWSTALTSAFPASASWTPLSTVRRRAMNPSGVRCPSTTQGLPCSAVFASQFTLDP